MLTAIALIGLVLAGSHFHLQPEGRVQALGLPQGWNLIALPGGTVPTGPAYTYQAGDAGYETLSSGAPLVAGLGYWVLAPSRSALPLGAGSATATIRAPAGQFVMVGDPSGISSALVSGADFLVVFDPVNGYQPVYDNVLQPGQGAFALSRSGGSIVLQAQGSVSQSCSTAETGSACPVSGACPRDYPVAVTQDAIVHPQPGPGDPAVRGTIALCFNDISQALAAGYQLAPANRIALTGPASATTSNIRFTVISATLESPDAFMSRVLASGDQLCSGCNIAGATAVVTVEYGVENLNRPQTLISSGTFISAHDPKETSPSYFLLASQHGIDPAHDGVPIAGSIGGVFAHTRFIDIDKVDWRLDNPLLDVSQSIPQPHGPSVEFELNFRGPRAGQIVAFGAGSSPLPPYNPYQSVPVPIPTATVAAPNVPAASAGTATPGGTPVATPAPSTGSASTTTSNSTTTSGGEASTTTGTSSTMTGPSGSPGTGGGASPFNPSAPFTR